VARTTRPPLRDPIGAEGRISGTRVMCPKLPEVIAVEDKSLYERLGGVFAIAAVVNHFSDALIRNPKVGQGSPNHALDAWSTQHLDDRLPGLKFMRTLWVCEVAGGPQKFVATEPGRSPLGLEAAHREFEITPDQFDEVAAELARTMRTLGVPEREAGEVLAAFAAHKGEVTEGSKAA
jgi:hemoglobin